MRAFSRVQCALIMASLLTVSEAAAAQVATIYGGADGLCGHRTASGERFNCLAMTAAHRRLPFGTHVRVCRVGCVTVRINDRGPWVRGMDIDLSPAAARAIGLHKTGHVTISVQEASSTEQMRLRGP
jgi:rare lipoprotein A